MLKLSIEVDNDTAEHILVGAFEAIKEFLDSKKK